MRTKKIEAWHFLRESRTLGYDADNLAVEPGYIYSIDRNRTPELCVYGMHGSVRAIDALAYAPGPVICRVRIWGDVVEGADKIVGRHREVVWMADATRTLHEFACWCVRYTPLADGRTTWDLLTDQRSRAAVETKERWLRGEATDAELAAAWAAAWAGAARDAARAAAKAAGAAAWDAVWDAARDAVWDVALDAQNTQLTAMLMDIRRRLRCGS